MQLSNTMYAWTAVRYGGPNADEIKVGPHPDKTDWTRPYVTSLGACFRSFKEMTDEQRVAQMFIDFHTAIIRDGIAPERADQEFLKIDGYWYIIAPGIERSKEKLR